MQFIEFVALTGGQQFLAGHSLVASGGPNPPRSFVFGDDLPFDTTGRRFLVGTASFAALGVVAPDYVVPDGFLFPGGGTINFAGDADIWNYPAMPVDGQLSLGRSGATAINSPRNFSNQTGTVQGGAADHNVQGLWWRSPAGSESGWGMNISHQGTILFVTWFTYDSDATGMWLVMPAARRTEANRYAGDILRTTGPAFGAVPFDPTLVKADTVGTGTLTFTDPETGSFAYSVNNVTQVKAITRQVFATPPSQCSQSAGGTGSRSYQDLWWRSPPGSESGWGVNLAHQGDILFGTWFTYGADAKGVWFVMPALRKGSGRGLFRRRAAHDGPRIQRSAFRSRGSQGRPGRHRFLHFRQRGQRHIRLHCQRRLAVEADRAPGLFDSRFRLRPGADFARWLSSVKGLAAFSRSPRSS